MLKSSNKSKTKVRIVLADDHNIVRAGVRQLLESADDLQVVAEAEDGEQAQALIEKHKPDVAVLDIQMPKEGLKSPVGCVRISRSGRVILTAYDDDPYVMAVSGGRQWICSQNGSGR
jgi:DNA-binding NarL/FixJ family response regulator